jgi:hypothetical protein
MAQLDRATREDIDQLLARAFAAWDSLATVERYINTWDVEDQLAFVEEWPLEEDRLQRLAWMAQADVLSESQRAQYRKLMELVEQRRTVVDGLLRA